MGPSERVTVTNMDQYNSILMIESLSPDHNGNYSCVARNVAAEVSHTQRLVVHGNPPLGPLQFARRPPDRPSFACACVCPLRACESYRPGSKMEAAHGSCVIVIVNGYCYIFWSMDAGLISKMRCECFIRTQRSNLKPSTMRFQANPRRDLVDFSSPRNVETWWLVTKDCSRLAWLFLMHDTRLYLSHTSS